MVTASYCVLLSKKLVKICQRRKTYRSSKLFVVLQKVHVVASLLLFKGNPTIFVDEYA